MAKRIDLAAYQAAIAERLAAAQAGHSVPALLGFEAGAHGWLVDLPAASEVIPPPPIAPVPLTQPWFVGLTSVHGELTGVVDFALFCGAAPTPRDGAARLVCIGKQPGNRIALLVGRVLGLKRSDTLSPAAADPPPFAAAWCGAAFTDHQGQTWRRLEVERLLADPAFLDAALPET